MFAPFDTSHFCKDTIGNIYNYYKSKGGYAEGETIWFRFDIAEGDTYHTKTIFWDSTHYYIVTVVSRNDSVNIRAGNFTNCIQIFFDQDNPGAIDEEMWFWIAPGVGIVKYKSFWTERWLYYAKIGGIVYPPGPLNIDIITLNTPDQFYLNQNYPNPFNLVTTIKYSLPELSYVEMRIYDLMGREIRTLINENIKAGYKSIIWDGKDSYGNEVSSGLYLYRIDAMSYVSNKDFHQTRKMVLLR